MELKDRNSQTKRVTGHLAKWMEMNLHKGHFHELSEQWGQKEALKHFQQEKKKWFSYHRSGAVTTPHVPTAASGTGGHWDNVLTVWRKNEVLYTIVEVTVD